MPLTTITKIGSIGALAIFMVSPVFAGPQDDGLWSQPFETNWPLLNINSLLTTPQGNILSIGVTGGGVGGTEFKLDVWNPELGTGAASHNNINNDVPDIGKYSAVLIPGTDNVFITGATDNFFSSALGTDIGSYIFNTQTNTVSRAADSEATNQQDARRETTTTSVLPSGEILVGGRDRQPEIYSPTSNQWRTLTGIDKGEVAWVVPNGEVITRGNDRSGFINTSGNGSVTESNVDRLFSVPVGGNSVMYRPGKFFYSRGIIEVNEREISTRVTEARTYPVLYSDRTILLPTGNTLSSGISASFANSSDSSAILELWDAATESRSLMVNDDTFFPSGSISLLKDGRVLALRNL